MKKLNKILITALLMTSALSAMAAQPCYIGNSCIYQVEGSRLGGHDVMVDIHGIMPHEMYQCSISVSGSNVNKISSKNFIPTPTVIKSYLKGPNEGPAIGPLIIDANQLTSMGGTLSFQLTSSRFVWQTNNVHVYCGEVH